MKKFISLMLTILLLASLLVGCNKNNNEDPPNVPENNTDEQQSVTKNDSKEKTKIIIDIWNWLEWEDINKALEDIQKDENFSHINFEIREKQGDYLTKMPVTIASGEQLDIIAVENPIQKANYASSGIIQPLDKYIESADLDFNELYGNYVKEAKFEDNIVMVPYQVTSWALFYNKAIFDHQGIPYPDPDKPMTWDEYRELAKQLTYGEGKDKKYGALHLTWPMFWYGEAIMELGGGTKFYNDEGLSNIENPAFAKALQGTYEMMHVDKSIPTHADLVISKTQPQAFMNGDYGMFIQGSWLLDWAANRETYPRDFEIGVAPLPVDSGSKVRKSWGVVDGFGIPPTSSNPEEALKVAVELSRLCSIYTTTTKTAYQPIESKDLFVGVGKKLSPEGMSEDVLKNAFANPETEFLVEKVTGKNAAEYEKVINEEVEKYFVQEQDLETTIKNIKKRGDIVIQEN